MTIRQRKLLGTVIFVTASVCYFFFVITIAMARLPNLPTSIHLIYYLIITVIWAFFAALLIRWMQKPGAEAR